MIFRLFKIYSTGKTIYSRVLKPVYDELKRDAEELEKKRRLKNKQKKKSHVINQESKRRHQRKANPKGF